ncbi:MAG: sugar phosphate isomerase/epimerase family protein [Bryobacteraceae bacterium]|nr:sugar phosphate isomerase/epimerase family protein [Bryobacteraceae bacterium]
MDHVLSTYLFVNHRLTAAVLDRIYKAGVPAVEIFCAKQHLDYTSRSQVRELGFWFRDSQLQVHSLHAPMFNDDVWGRSGPHAVLTITEPSKPRRTAMVDEIKRAIEIAETIPFQFLIQHIGVSGEEYDERKLEAAMISLEELRIFAKQRGVDILVENIPNALSSAERLHAFLEISHLGLGYCFDTGHAHMNEGVDAAFEMMAARIRSTHVHDNDGKEDLHHFPYRGGGNIPWKRVMELFRTRPGQFPLVLELAEIPDLAQPLDAVREVFERLENE